MLTKKLTFTNDVLVVLKNMDWQNNGLLGVIQGQLDRKLYVETNKALEAMGGKWNKKSGGHLFSNDPRDLVDGLLVSGKIDVEKDGFFETPLSIVNKMIDIVPPLGRILEPSAGLGAIVDNLRISKSSIFCVEKNQIRVDVLRTKGYSVFEGDFLSYHTATPFDTIYMNPPFEELQDIDHVRYAYNQLADGGKLISIMSESPFFRNNKSAIDFRDWLQEFGWSEKLPNNSFKPSGTGVNTRIVFLNK